MQTKNIFAVRKQFVLSLYQDNIFFASGNISESVFIFIRTALALPSRWIWLTSVCIFIPEVVWEQKPGILHLRRLA